MFRLTIVALLVPAFVRADEKDEKTELKKFEGTWKVKSFEFSGKKDAPPAEEREKLRLTFKGTKLSIKGTPQGDQETTIEIDSSKKPAHITINAPKGEPNAATILGIYKFDKDVLTICGGPEKRPEEFALKDGTHIALLILERIKDEEKKKKE